MSYDLILVRVFIERLRGDGIFSSRFEHEHDPVKKRLRHTISPPMTLKQCNNGQHGGAATGQKKEASCGA